MPFGNLFVTDEGYLMYQGITGTSGVGVICTPDGFLSVTGMTGPQGPQGQQGVTGITGPPGYGGGSIVFGDGADGDLTINTGYLPRTLIRARNLTIGTGTIVLPSNCNGAIIFVRDILTIASGGSLNADFLGGSGAAGGRAGAQSGAAGNAVAGNSIPTGLTTHLSSAGVVATSINTTTGGADPGQVGFTGPGYTGMGPDYFQGGRGAGGGAGGGGGFTGRPGAKGGSQESPNLQYNYGKDNNLREQPIGLPTFVSAPAGIIVGGGGAGGGGGGWGGPTGGTGVDGPDGGTGGAGGRGGGWLWIAARQIQNNGIISCNGQTGLPGGNGTGAGGGSGAGGGGAGGGGGGGGGGFLVIRYSIGSIGTSVALGGLGGKSGEPGSAFGQGATGGRAYNGENGGTGICEILQIV